MQQLPHGTTLSCRSAGERGRPVLLFLHGFPEAAFVWDGLLEYFADPAHGGFRCVAPNMRGYEHSSAPHEVDAYRAKFLVQDIAELIVLECSEPTDAQSPAAVAPAGRLACLIAHDWGGAVAWNLAASQPHLMARLAIINAPHPATFLRELQRSPAQQAASVYMNFLCRADAPALLAENDYHRLWALFESMGATSVSRAWLTDCVRQQYRAVWSLGLHGGCNYYRASPLRPASGSDAGAAAIAFPKNLFTVTVPTQVIWGLGDVALLPALLDGLDEFVPHLEVERVADATHWIVHEQPAVVIDLLRRFLA